MNKKEIRDIIEKLNCAFQVDFQENPSCKDEYFLEYEGSVKLDGNESILMQILFKEHFPLVLPDFFVDNTEKFRAHVGINGKICLFDTSSILVNQDMPDQIVFDCYVQAIKILNITPGSKEYNEEVSREFESYWMTVMKREAYSSVDIDNISYKECPMVCMNRMSMISETSEDAKAMLVNTYGLKEDESVFERKCIFIRIRDGSAIIPFSKSFKWNTVRKYIMNNTSSSVKRQFQKFLDLRVKSAIRFILLIYKGTQGKILFGFRVQFKNHRYLKIENSYNCIVENVFVRRIDYQYLVMRGGAFNSLKEKNVLLMGGGSVGGYIASNLCQAGITNIDILDNDIFMPDNVHRHFLGFDSLKPGKSQYKSDLLKERLENQYPYVDIDSLNFVNRSAEAFIERYERFKNYDIIISALGEPTINLEINRLLVEKRIKVPFICCFNEPYGIGGHVIIVNLDETSCLRCLYTDIISEELVAFRGSFVEPNQYFKKNVSGCSSAFVPYSCLDSQQTAILATRKIVDILNMKQIKNGLYSWIGNSDSIQEQGFKISQRYICNKEKGFIQEESFANRNCKVCKGRKGNLYEV